MVTLIAINLGYVVAGAITAEIVFNWPGLGTLTVQALDARDYPLLQAHLPAHRRVRRVRQPHRRHRVRLPRPAGADVSVTGIAGTELGAGRWRTTRRTKDFLGQLLGRTDGLIGVTILVVVRRARDLPGAVRRAAARPLTSATGQPLEPPSLTYPFGTDELGRDLLNLTVHGARISMTIGLLATLSRIVIGVRSWASSRASSAARPTRC